MKRLPLVLLLGAGACTGMHDWPGVAQARPDDPQNPDLFHYAPQDAVQTYGADGGGYLIHYTTAGTHAVPAVDSNRNGVPDYVESVAQLHEEVDALYHGAWGMRRALADDGVPGNHGGDGRFDVYLLDFGLSADGAFRAECQGAMEACPGFMVQENDFAGYGYPSADYGNRVLCSHEYFHAVQAAYDTNMGSVMGEGTAVWASEKFDPSLGDFEGFLPGYFDNPDRSLDKPLPGPVDPFSYGSAVFFKFLDERLGGGVIRQLWEDSENQARGVANPVFLPTLDALLQREFHSSFGEAFLEFTVWNLFTGAKADSSRAWLDARAYPALKMNARTLPMQEHSLRLFYASAQYYVFSPGGRTQVTAQVVPSTLSPGDVDGVAMLLVTRLGNRVGPVSITPATQVGPVLDTALATDVVLAVVNPFTAGNSRRLNLCAGSPQEVQDCAAQVLGVDGGSADAGDPTWGDAGAVLGGGGDASPPRARGCQCVGGAPLVLWGWVWAVAVLGARRRAWV